MPFILFQKLHMSGPLWKEPPVVPLSYIILSTIQIVKYHDPTYFAHVHICACQDEHCNSNFDRYLSLIYVGSTCGTSKIAKPTVFQVVLRGIGKSFQSAITAPRINLIGYGNATAQS